MTYQIHLSPKRATQAADAVAKLEAAIAAGMVPNVLYVDAKETINRAIHDASEAFLQTGPHTVVPAHHQSDWWLAAYRGNAFCGGASNVNSALKRAAKIPALTEYTALLTSMLPLVELLATAKPLIKKRNEMPKIKTAKQIADEADQMTCQCCGRGIFAATGVIAHHGYERPGDGYQTASCFGARELPWEVSRDALGRLITHLKSTRKAMIEARDDVASEKMNVSHLYIRYEKNGLRTPCVLSLTRESFAAVKAENKDNLFDFRNTKTFDDYKADDLADRESKIRNIGEHINECTTRYNGWRQTHKRAGGKWVAL